MTTNITKAFTQWRSRPVEERFWSLDDLLRNATERKLRSSEHNVDKSALSIVGDTNNDRLVLNVNDEPLTLSNWSFNQLCLTVGAPASFLADISVELAAKCLQERLLSNAPESGFQILKSDDFLRACTSQTYARVWDADILVKLISCAQDGWRVPPARPVPGLDDPRARQATEADVLLNSKSPAGLDIKVGDMIVPAGLYMSDRDLFVFMVDDQRPIEPGDGQALCRGFILTNSEVRAGKFSLLSFLYNGVCGNHIVWDVSQVKEVSWKHVGNVEARVFDSMEATFKEYAHSAPGLVVDKIKQAKLRELGKDEEEVVGYLFSKVFARTPVSQKFIKRSYDLGVQFEHQSKASPTTVWGFLDGATRASQELSHTNDRQKIDAIVADRLMSLV